MGTALIHWWQAVDATNWNIYTGASPPVFGAVPNGTATADPATGVLTIVGAGITFTPTLVPDATPLGTITELFSHTIPTSRKESAIVPIWLY